MEKISWTDGVRNEEVLHRVNEEMNILHTMKIRMDNFTGHILRKNCVLKEVIEGKEEGRIEVTRRLGRRRSQLLLLLSSVGDATLVGFGMLNYR